MDNEQEPTFLPEIRRARYERLTIFEVSESELEMIEKGLPDSILLNIAIALLSSALSLTATVTTATISSISAYVVFVVFIVVAYVVGLVLLILWLRSRKSVGHCVGTIRSRLPPEGDAKSIE
jgi:uncharacterized membrane protein YdbT with pleckstrin-like domain